MRRLAVVAFALCGAASSACAPKPVLAPVVTAPKFPEFTRPPVPPALAADPAGPGYERAWRFLQAGDFRNADRELAAVLRLSPAFYPAETAAGYVELARKDPKSALDHFDRALAKDGESASALVGRGDALVALDRQTEAVVAFDAAVAADPTLADVRRRAEVLRFRGAERDIATARDLDKSGQLADAVAAYRLAIASSPDSAFLYRELGGVERKQNDSAGALESFRKAVSLDPTDANSLAQIGDVLDAEGDRAEALAAYDRSLAIEPSPAVEARRDAASTRAALDKLPEEYRAIDAAPQVTRADLAALIGVRLSATLQSMRARDAVVVTDVRNNWAEAWIMTVTRAGVMEAYANHTFQPRAVVRRSDLALVVSRMLSGVAAPAAVDRWRAARLKFTDVAETHLAYPAASLAVASGVMQVEADGGFGPSRAVTGAEAVQAVDRLQAMAVPSANAGQAAPRR
jgi:tetratricopeptide (TPR) repeat protein